MVRTAHRARRRGALGAGGALSRMARARRAAAALAPRRWPGALSLRRMDRLGRSRRAEQRAAASDAASVLVRGGHRDGRGQTRGVARGGTSWRRRAYGGAGHRAQAHAPLAARDRARGGARDPNREAPAAADAAGGYARGRGRRLRTPARERPISTPPQSLPPTRHPLRLPPRRTMPVPRSLSVRRRCLPGSRRATSRCAHRRPGAPRP